MKFSVKGEYGIRAIVDIALYEEAGPRAVNQIANRQGIPMRFLEQVMNSLRKGGLVESFRGASGGYRLARQPEEITLADVVQAVEGPITLMDCVAEGGACDRTTECVIREVFCDVQRSVIDTLAAVTLADIIKRTAAKEAERVPMFEI
jgi:Rrf2 family protein